LSMSKTAGRVEPHDGQPSENNAQFSPVNSRSDFADSAIMSRK